MTRLFITGLVFNLVLGLILLFFSSSWSVGYLIGSLAMLINLLALSRRGWVAGASFLTFIGLTYGVVQGLPASVLTYALGLASPAFYSAFCLQKRHI
jgi:hypothetical protein